MSTALRIQDLPSLEELWEQAPPPSAERFEPSMLAELPEPGRRYLAHAIQPGTVLARSVRLHMRGRLLVNEWYDFEAEQVIVWDRGLVWRARARRGLFSIRGFDRVVDGLGEMRWRLMGLIPVMSARGPDITRSATGRHEIECTLLPSVFLDPQTRWTSPDAHHADVTVAHGDQEAQVHLTLRDDGSLASAWLERWGNPDGAGWHDVPFGVVCEEDGTFDGYAIPRRIRAGWHFNPESGAFDEGGEFFQAEITTAEFR